MQFTITTIFALFAAATMAAPSAAVVDASLVVRDTSAVSALQAQAESFLAAKEAAGCSKLSTLCPLQYAWMMLTTTAECIAALAPTVVSCAAALAEAGLNPIADAACIATLANSSFNPVSTLPYTPTLPKLFANMTQPASCQGC
jgi:hypothetical protein